MNVIEALNSRFCARAFKPDPVDKETIIKILEAATRAPSWANTQPWGIFVAGGEVLERLRQSYLANFHKGAPRNPDLPAPQQWPSALQKRIEELLAERFNIIGTERDESAARQALFELNYKFFGAPVVIYLCMDRTLSPWSIFDIGMIAQSIMLAAQQYGVGSAPAFTFVTYPDLIRAEFGIPEDLSIIIGLALGYSDLQHPENKFRSSRRPIREAVHFKGF